jgi:hypothetical protein
MVRRERGNAQRQGRVGQGWGVEHHCVDWPACVGPDEGQGRCLETGVLVQGGGRAARSMWRDGERADRGVNSAIYHSQRRLAIINRAQPQSQRDWKRPKALGRQIRSPRLCLSLTLYLCACTADLTLGYVTATPLPLRGGGRIRPARDCRWNASPL